MGLDMYAFTVSQKDAGDNVVDLKRYDENDVHETISSTEIFYWRKFNALHGWMEQLYRAKGGAKESFNCTTVRLDKSDLDRLEMDTGNNKLVPINGFFFGNQAIHPEDLKSVASFVAKSRAAISEGQAVYYDSWW
jgi:hypothetical protein